MKNVTFIIWAFVVLCAGCSSSTSVVQDEVSMTKKQLADKVKGGWTAKRCSSPARAWAATLLPPALR